jgi:NADH:ubiquinone oxidoreductase subunit D
MSSPFPSKLSKRVSKEMGSSMRSIDSILENLEDGKSRSSSDGATSPDHIYDMKHQWRAVLEQIKECTPDMNQEEVQLSVENCTNVLHRAGYVSFFLFSNVLCF